MPSEILAKPKTVVEPTISLASIGNAAGRISAVIDNTATKAGRGYLGIKVKTGTTPTANNTIRVYLIRQTAEANNVKGGGGALGDIDAAVTAEPVNAELVMVITNTATSDTEYSEVVMVYDPGPKFSIVVWNGSGAALHATPPTPSVQWLPVVDEAQ